jgi:hypothetical protein
LVEFVYITAPVIARAITTATAAMMMVSLLFTLSLLICLY